MHIIRRKLSLKHLAALYGWRQHQILAAQILFPLLRAYCRQKHSEYSDFPNMNTIAVVDYGMGNLRSVSKALEYVDSSAAVTVTSDPATIRAASRVVVPGQGAMPHCMQALAHYGVSEAVLDAANNNALVRVCLGLQMLYDKRVAGNTGALGMLPGIVKKLESGNIAEGASWKFKI